eukprot:713475-Pelagomonas_calceolata.AAC.3
MAPDLWCIIALCNFVAASDLCLYSRCSGFELLVSGCSCVGKGCEAVPAYVGSLAGAKKVPVTKPVRSGEQEQNMKFSHSISST